MNRLRVRFLIGVVSLLAASGCDRFPLVDLRSPTCPQTYEFGNYGCVVFAGRVIGTQDQPLTGVLVGPRPGADGGQFNGDLDATDANGHFQFRLSRFARSPSESASVWIRATVIPTLGDSVATIFDSVLVRVRVAPVGQVPDTARLVIRLPVP